MMIVITAEQNHRHETDIINELFEHGLDLLHIRKPLITELEMDRFITKIHDKFHAKLVLHSHYTCAHRYAIHRLHVNESLRNKKVHQSLNWLSSLSTSVHDIKTFNKLEPSWDYAFISPYFPSISKNGYGLNSSVDQEIKNRTNYRSKLIALGGIQENSIHRTAIDSIDGIAIMGAIWKSSNPIRTFKACKNTYHKHFCL